MSMGGSAEIIGPRGGSVYLIGGAGRTRGGPGGTDITPGRGRGGMAGCMCCNDICCNDIC